MPKNPDTTPDIHIEVASIFGAISRRGLVELRVGDVRTLMDVAKAREVTAMLVQATEAAISDELLVRFLMEKVGVDLERAGAALLDFRELRQGSRNVVWPN
jgi:hypothetical protein